MSDIKTVMQVLESVSVLSTTPSIKRLPEGYIIDETKSVIWNREQVEINHKKYDTAKEALKASKTQQIKDLLEQVYAYIQSELECNIAQAVYIYEFAYRENHAYGWSAVHEGILEQIEVITDYLALGKKE